MTQISNVLSWTEMRTYVKRNITIVKLSVREKNRPLLGLIIVLLQAAYQARTELLFHLRAARCHPFRFVEVLFSLVATSSC